MNSKRSSKRLTTCTTETERLETIFCTGQADRIRDLVYQLRDFDVVGRVNLMFLQPVA